MKVSLNWLKDYVKTDLEANQIAEILTDTGLEVEKVEEIDEVPGGLRGVVVGEIIEKWAHPNADRLNLTKVNIGAGNHLQIVCGAPNVAVGQKVLVSTIGAMLYPISGEPFKIKKGKIRGELSEGMICAEEELGLGKSHDGIMVLDPAAIPGTPAAQFLNMSGDTSIEIGLTPNRTDAMGHFGVARDLVVGVKHMENLIGQNLSAELHPPSLKPLSVSKTCPVKVTITAPELCDRYTGVVISGLRIGASPDWLKNRLRTIGLEPINNVVDITNYVLHEFGHPLHAFDLSAIENNEIHVRTLPEGTKFRTLDGKDRQLSETDLMITNGANSNEKSAMCLAGVFGGEQSGVSDKTNSIFLECASFNSVSVRKTAKRHLLNTDASFRFERGVDPDACLNVLSRAANLILELAGGQIDDDAVDLYPGETSKISIPFSPLKCNKVIGIDIPFERMEQILIDLDFEIEKKENIWHCNAPKYRVDVTREADVIEEVLRIYGYNSIPLPKKLNASLSYFGGDNEEAKRNRVADMLSSQGYLEMMSNSLTKAGHSEVSLLEKYGEPVALLNPLSQDLGELRTGLAYNMLSAVIFNINRKSSDLKLYEFGNVYAKSESGYKEKLVLGLLSTGNRLPESWNNESVNTGMQEVLYSIESVLKRLNIKYKLKQEGNTLTVLKKKIVLASARKATPQELAHFGIQQEVYLGFIEWDELRKLRKEPMAYAQVSKFPEVTRDLSLLLDDRIKFTALEASALQSGGSLLKSVILFDVYEGNKLPKGKKSYAIRYTLSDSSKTLDDKIIEKTMAKILNSYEKNYGAELR